MALRYRLRILDHLSHRGYQPSTRGAILRAMKVEDDDREDFDRAIEELITEEMVQIGSDKLVRLPRAGDEVTGTLRIAQKGYGFIATDGTYREGDIFVPRGSTMDAISGDRVRANVVRQQGRGGSKGRSDTLGRVVEVLERGRTSFVGVLVKNRGAWMVEPDGRDLRDPVIIRDPYAKNAKAGDKVAFELLQYPEDDYHAEGVITRVLGEAGRPDVETAAVIEVHGLRSEFPDAVIDEAREASRRLEADESDWGDREDLRERFIFTIDPPDAKDFDDAISIERDTNRDEWTLGVHIADVSHYVRPGSLLDEEAMARGNSVYLPRLVLPMLPEVLSNGVCSLQEGVPRLCKSVFITFDAKGRVLHQRPSATVIRSAKRLTYLEAQALIDGDAKGARKHARGDGDYSETLTTTLSNADTLAKTLRARRIRDGMIVLDLPDVELVFDDDGHVIDAVPEDDAFTHTIIEMFMVEANEALARLFDGIGVPILRRIHPEPMLTDLDDIRMLAATAKIKIPDEPTRHDLQRLLRATHGTPAARAIHFAVLRAMTKATYSPALIGHFALASAHYAHFTSPIRRYPDLTLHRAITAYLGATDNGTNVPGGRKRRTLGKRLLDDERVPDEGQLIELGRHCSETEVQAEAAERELREFLVMQFLAENHIGDEFKGVVTGLASAGVFISLERFLVDGMVRMEDLPSADGRPDRWTRNDRVKRLYARRSGASLGPGDIVTVQIAAVDPASRQMDLSITRLPERSAAEEVEVAAAGRRRGQGHGPNQGKSKRKGKGRGKRRGR